MTRSQNAYLIIGAGAAGMAAAATLRRADPAARITVLSAESDSPYFRPMIPYLISGQKKTSDMAMEGCGPFITQGADIRLSAHVSTIDARRQTVILDSGEELIYDKLLIATGSRPIIPRPIQDQSVKAVNGIYTLKTLADARAIAQRCQSARQVVLLGGGMLNVKTAFALLALGLEVTIVEIGDSILPWLMEADAATLIHRSLLDAGMKVITGATLKRLHYTLENGITRVELSNGQNIACQMLLFGMGIQPNISMLEKTPLRLNKGVIIDTHCATSQENVFAAGDVATVFDSHSGAPQRIGLWSHAVEMGRCAALNMAGRSVEYTLFRGTLNAVQVADIPFVSIGRVHTEDTDYEVHVSTTPDSYRKLVFSSRGDRLIGALFLGDITSAGTYQLLIQQRMPVAHIKDHIIRHRLHYGHFLSKAA
jgi:NAD(P)H-nitrite reductase large subunit